MITGFYAAVLALAQIYISLKIVRLRHANKVSLGDGGIDELQSYMRAHGDFTETVPMALILMAVIEFGGPAFWGYQFILLHVMGVLLILGRAFHYYALTTPPGYGRWRKHGMQLTFLVYAIGAALALWSFIVGTL